MKPFLLLISITLSNLSVFTILLNGLDSCIRVARTVFEEVQQICGLEGRADKSLLAERVGKLPGLRGPALFPSTGHLALAQSPLNAAQSQSGFKSDSP